MKQSFLIAAQLTVSLLFGAEPAAQPGLISSEFIFDTAPFPSCHASTLVETRGVLVAAWFGGTREGAADVSIWTSRKENGKWLAPVIVSDGDQPDGKHFPHWNPVLFRPRNGPLMLFYKIGSSPGTWRGMLRASMDDGATWSDPNRLPAGILGPIKNKPVQLASGEIICPSSSEANGWRVHFEITADLGKTWHAIEPAPDSAGAGGNPIRAIQPSILFLADGRLQAIGRTRDSKLFETFSNDNGKSWSALALTQLPNPNSGIDAVTLKDGRQLLVYNHTAKGRSPLNVAISKDGKEWSAAIVLESEPGEYSYPCVIQTSDGLVHIAYTWKRQKIKHAVIDPNTCELKPIVNGEWPK